MQGNELRECRKSLGLTQEQLAETLGLTQTYIGLMERGAKPIEPRTALAVYYLRELDETRHILKLLNDKKMRTQGTKGGSSMRDTTEETKELFRRKLERLTSAIERLDS